MSDDGWDDGPSDASGRPAEDQVDRPHACLQNALRRWAAIVRWPLRVGAQRSALQSAWVRTSPIAVLLLRECEVRPGEGSRSNRADYTAALRRRRDRHI